MFYFIRDNKRLGGQVSTGNCEALIIDFKVSISLHRTVRVWLKRDSGTYWPSIVNFMPSQCSSLGKRLPS